MLVKERRLHDIDERVSPLWVPVELPLTAVELPLTDVELPLTDVELPLNAVETVEVLKPADAVLPEEADDDEDVEEEEVSELVLLPDDSELEVRAEEVLAEELEPAELVPEAGHKASQLSFWLLRHVVWSREHKMVEGAREARV